MSQHPHTGIPGAKPRLPETPSNGSPASKEALARLSAEYLRSRNAQLASKAAMAEMELQRRRGALIGRYDAKVALGFLLTGLRQRLMSLPYALPRRMVGQSEHAIGRLLDEEMRAALRDIASWPDKMARPGWAEEIAPDLRPPTEVAGNGDGDSANNSPSGSDSFPALAERRNAERRRKYSQAKEG
jgi:hypothetical protein